MDKMNPGLIERAQASKTVDHSAEIKKMVAAMPQQLRPAFQQIVEAGKQILYGPDTRQAVTEFLMTDAPIEERLGNGIANLVILIDNRANGNLPKEALIPAGTVLLFDAADVLRQSGESISVDQIGKAYEMMIYGIFAGYGMEPDQVDAAFEGMAQKLKTPSREDDLAGEEPTGQEDDAEEEYQNG